MESKNNKAKLEVIRRKLGFTSSSYVDPDGLSGGLALWWDGGVDVEVETADKNIIHTIVTDISNHKLWAATFVYGCPSRAGRESVWDDIRSIARSESLPWMCLGDFNQVMQGSDKLGGHYPSQNSIIAFHGLISDCGRVDLEYKGPKYTWRNNRRGEDFIMERIDLAFANSKWRELYDKAMVFVEPAIGSNHNPLLLNTDVPLNRVGKPFRFESFWATEDSYKSVVEDSWIQNQEGSLMYSVCQKLRTCKVNLKNWSKQLFGDLRSKIDYAKEHLIEIQRQLELKFNPDLLLEEKKLLETLKDLWQKDSMFATR
ncbi:hypothetical protein Vadar_011960 [Vaccinium darrowii]|uniref:Uncharacterized protein n=1 Tax=Vaccinium darrowii TaxID=229202 RepID=A0ACB7YDP7_9ERIC|nr:hypothetical protein Vadar_011960 [Vaccinium darrowii]